MSVDFGLVGLRKGFPNGDAGAGEVRMILIRHHSAKPCPVTKCFSYPDDFTVENVTSGAFGKLPWGLQSEGTTMPSSANEIIRPKLVALDSSHLSGFAADKATSDRTRLARAEAFERAFEESGSVLLLCWHHFQELLAHGSEAVVAKRVEYLQSLPTVASIASFRNEDVVGTIVDVQSFEVAAAHNDPVADPLTIRDDVAKRMFRFTSGADLVRPFLQSWRDVRRALAEREPRNGEIVAISRSKFTNNGNEKIVDLLKGKVRAPDDIQRQFQRLHGTLSTDIRERGDKRIIDAESSSRAFLDEVRRLGLEAIEGDNPVLAILKRAGVDLAEIGPETTVADVGNLAVFRRKLEVLNRSLNLPFEELKARVKEDRLPSGIISTAIARYHPDTREWDGSELADRYLACLAAYADVTYVDKRTHEASRQARQKSTTFASIVGYMEKSGGYSEIAKQLSALFAKR
ncbi:hypothetical protein [Bradyrhizobium sp. HKCCYLS2033]|uniref:hypothetical protein n=1 Tax=unclassified Bradyrhizobium TaxID=2631580 RepID=UPI003EB8576A